MLRRLLPLTPLVLMACHSTGGTSAAPAVTADQIAIEAAVARDYAARYSGNACVASQTIARKGPEPIPSTVAGKAVTWTYLERDAQGLYQMVDDQLASTLAAAWAQARTRDYPALTLPGSVQRDKPANCGRTLTLTSPMIVANMAFVRWDDGTSRRTIAIYNNGKGWAVLAEGPAKIG
ncbi:MAG TPA: hypothetical protein VN137_03660 [Sphingomonas sp.]|nr:hypothetical protein [Sphingomonas sp.]